MSQLLDNTYQNVTTTVKLSGKDVKIHALCTGVVAVKTAFKSRTGAGPLAKINILLDDKYTEYMPIWVWIIEHPEGIIAIDTGEIIQAKDRNTYLANESAYSRYIAQRTSKFIIEQEIIQSFLSFFVVLFCCSFLFVTNRKRGEPKHETNEE